MRYALPLALGVMLTANLAAAKSPQDPASTENSAEIKSSRAIVQQFATTLKDALQGSY